MRPETARMKEQIRGSNSTDYERMKSFLLTQGEFVGIIGWLGDGPDRKRYEAWMVADFGLILGVDDSGQIGVYSFAGSGGTVEADIAYLKAKIKIFARKSKPPRPRKSRYAAPERG